MDEALALATRTGELQRLGPVAVARAAAADRWRALGYPDEAAALADSDQEPQLRAALTKLGS